MAAKSLPSCATLVSRWYQSSSFCLRYHFQCKSLIAIQEELFSGVIKKFNINRRIRDGPTGGYVQVSKTIECPIKAGYKAGTKLTFPDDGDEQPDGDRFCFCLFFCRAIYKRAVSLVASARVLTTSQQHNVLCNMCTLGSFQDIQFVIQEKSHPLFERQGNDLIHKRCPSFYTWITRHVLHLP